MNANASAVVRLAALLLSLAVVAAVTPTQIQFRVISVTDNTDTIASWHGNQNSPGYVDYADSGASLDGVSDIRTDNPGDEFPAFPTIPAPDSMVWSGESLPTYMQSPVSQEEESRIHRSSRGRCSWKGHESM